MLDRFQMPGLLGLICLDSTTVAEFNVDFGCNSRANLHLVG